VWGLIPLIIAPAAFWIGYVYYNDRRKPEPFSKIALSYLLGIAAAFGASALYDALPALGLPGDPMLLAEKRPLAFLAYALFVIGPVEELSKFIPYWAVCVRLKEFDEPVDGIVYASAVALGFASYENLFLLQQLDGAALVGRAIASPLVHVVVSSVWGHAGARVRLRLGGGYFALALSVIAAAVLHGAYDFLAMSSSYAAWSAAVVLALWIWRIIVLSRLEKQPA